MSNNPSLTNTSHALAGQTKVTAAESREHEETLFAKRTTEAYSAPITFIPNILLLGVG